MGADAVLFGAIGDPKYDNDPKARVMAAGACLQLNRPGKAESLLQGVPSEASPVASWYLDMGMVKSYWGAERKYHHTAPINMIYALHQSLYNLLEEGLEAAMNRFN